MVEVDLRTLLPMQVDHSVMSGLVCAMALRAAVSWWVPAFGHLRANSYICSPLLSKVLALLFEMHQQ